MNKKTLSFVAVAIILVLIGLGIYFYLSKKAPSGPLDGLFPGLGSPTTPNPNVGDGENTNIPFTRDLRASLPRLYELHKTPVAGAGFIESGKAPGLLVKTRYIERGLGHIYETPLDTLSKNRISNETLPRLSEALWGNGGKSVVIRSFDEAGGIIKTRILNLGEVPTSFAQGTSTKQASSFIQTEEVFLPDYIPFVAVVEDGSDKLFYLENGVESAVGSTANFRGAGTSIFSSSFTEWLPQFPNQKLITLTTKPSASVLGHFFFLDTQTKAITKILDSINGLTTLTSRDGKLVLFSETKKGVPELFVYNIAKKETSQLFIQTLPEKCVWSTQEPAVVYCAVPQITPPAQYPDQWYQGLISFSDSLWKINTVTFITEKIYALPSLDLINPVISSGDAYLLFMNKVSGTPWVFRMAEDAPKPISVAPTEVILGSTPTTGTRTPSAATTKSAPTPPTDPNEGMVKIK